MIRAAAILAAILAAAAAALAVAAPARADTLVVLNKAEASASLIDPDSGKTVASVATGQGPHEVAISSDGKTAVVTNYGSRGAPGSSLTVIDIATARSVKTISLGTHRRPHGIAWVPGDRLVVVTTEDSRDVVCVDVARGSIVGTIATDQDVSHMVALTPDGARAFVANIGSGSVTVLDLASEKRIRSIATGAGAEGIDVTPDGKHVWVTNRAADTVSVIDTKTLDIVASVSSKGFPIRATITPQGDRVLVSNARAGTISVFDARTRKLERTIDFGKPGRSAKGRLFGARFGKSSVPIGVVTDPGGKRAFVAHAHADTISVVDLRSWKVVGSLRAGKEPDGMAYSTITAATVAEPQR